MSNAPQRSADVLPFAATETTLPNGLRVIVVPTGYPNLVSLQIPVQTGSRNEVEAGLSGFAHFFEHMMFRGTERYPAAAYQDVVTRSGARQNAYTTDDYTNYHITFAKEDLETILAIEADRFMNLAYEEADFKTEARAVLGEYNKSSADPLHKLVEVQHEQAFTVHPYKHTTMGFLRDIEDMPNQYAYSRLFFDRWYRPEYATLIVAGDVDAATVLPLVERYWGSWQRGSHGVTIPAEPAAERPVAAHVAWATDSLPIVTVAFHGPAFSETDRDYAALEILLDLELGETSDLYRRLVEEQQLVDQLFVDTADTVDPSLWTVFARVLRADDTVTVRDAILSTLAGMRRSAIARERLEDAKAHARYAFVRALDNSESIASTLARFVRVRRSYETVNALYRTYEALEPDDLLRAARVYLRDAAIVQTTLSREPLPEALGTIPVLDSFATGGPALVVQRSPSALLRFKIQFRAGSAHDPPGQEGLAALSAAMISGGGSQAMRIDEINRALFPMAASFESRVDRELTTFTAVVHRDRLEQFAAIALPQLLAPGLRESDFSRLKAAHLNGLIQDLRSNNEEELGRERLQTSVFAGTPYGHTALGTVAGLEAISLADVRQFVAERYVKANLVIGAAGDVPEPFLSALQAELGKLPDGSPAPARAISGRRPVGREVEIIEKETRATAISFGFPIDVTRAHTDFAALWLARSWLGEHRASQGRLFQRLREVRGLNYGDYAYIEAFPGGMYRTFPDPGVPRRQQLFEIWIRPVAPENATFALKLAIHELRRLIEQGLTEEEFGATRNYLMKNVFLMIKTQDQQLGYALDSRWYGTGDFIPEVRVRLTGLTAGEVNEAVRRHLSAENLNIVIVTQDAQGLREQLLNDAAGIPVYDAPHPELREEDGLVASESLGIKPENLRITPVDEIFAR